MFSLLCRWLLGVLKGVEEQLGNSILTCGVISGDPNGFIPALSVQSKSLLATVPEVIFAGCGTLSIDEMSWQLATSPEIYKNTKFARPLGSLNRCLCHRVRHHVLYHVSNVFHQFSP